MIKFISTMILFISLSLSAMDHPKLIFEPSELKESNYPGWSNWRIYSIGGKEIFSLQGDKHRFALNQLILTAQKEGKVIELMQGKTEVYSHDRIKDYFKIVAKN